MRAIRPPEERFWEKVDTSGDCWLWTASQKPNGYGQFGLGQHTVVHAHRFAYELLVGPIGEGLQIDHLCRVRHCVNPAHLEPVTPRVNARRGFGASGRNARKTHCPAGHPYAGDNLYRYPITGDRHCRACGREQKRRAVA